ncbi:MAG: IPT/TIG domain-containing protein [Planctomycetota bacterium]
MKILIPAILFISSFTNLAYSQETSVALTGGSGVTGDVVSSSVSLDSSVVVQGWSMGVCHDEANLELLSASDGPTTAIVNGGSAPDFNEVNIYPEGVTVGVVISFIGSADLQPGVGFGLLDLEYSLIGIADPGGFSIDAEVSFCGTLGSPPVDVVVVSGGSSLVPTQTNAVVQIIPPPDFCLDLSCEGGVSDTLLSWAECTPFDYVLVHRDGELIAMLDPGVVEYLDADLDPGSYTYALLGVVFPDANSAPEVVSALCTAVIIPVTAGGVNPTAGHYLGGQEITVTGTGFVAAADTVVTIDGVGLVDQVVIDDSTITGFLPAATHGIGQFDVRVSNSLGEAVLPQAFTYGFIRGVVNGDVVLDIGDAMYLCMWLFSAGVEPICLEAAEVNGDDMLDIADPIFIVMYLFRDGPSPIAPFPDAGLDPDSSGGFGCNP